MGQKFCFKGDVNRFVYEILDFECFDPYLEISYGSSFGGEDETISAYELVSRILFNAQSDLLNKIYLYKDEIMDEDELEDDEELDMKKYEEYVYDLIEEIIGNLLPELKPRYTLHGLEDLINYLFDNDFSASAEDKMIEGLENIYEECEEDPENCFGGLTIKDGCLTFENEEKFEIPEETSFSLVSVIELMMDNYKNIF